MRHRPYAEYRDSGVEWLGSVPPGWDVKRFRYCCRIQEGQVDPEDQLFSERVLIAPNHIESGTGRILLQEASAEQGAISGKYRVDPGDLIYSKIRPALRKACISEGHWLCSADMYPIRVMGSRLNPRFLLYFVLSDPFSRLMIDESMRVAMPKVNRETLADTPLLLPPAADQAAIVSLLDAETAAIDTLIARKERLVELLQEKRAALITRAVTRGLDSSVPMKESGVEWLGEIPAHWELRKAGSVFVAISGATPAVDNPQYWDGGIPWVTPKDMKRPLIDSSEDTLSEAGLREAGLGLIQPPVVLIVVRGMILAHSFPVAVTSVPATVNQDMKALVPLSLADPRFVAHLLRGLARPLLAGLVDEAAHGTKAIRMDRWRSFPLPLPPVEEQQEITHALDIELSREDALAHRIKDGIDGLREYRTALISAAVTGKIDLRGGTP